MVFLCLNAWLSYATPFDFDRSQLPYRGWNWWMFQDLRDDERIYNVALLGSSLMVSAIAGCDANYLKRSVDMTRYHRVAYLDHQLRARFGGAFNTFNLSSPGQMPSDAYLTLRAMVAEHNRPEIVIYGISPRDFIDSTLQGPSETEPFQYFRRLVNIDDVASRYLRSAWTRLNWWLERGLYLYGYSLDIQMACDGLVGKVLDGFLPKPYRNPPFTWWDRVSLLPGYKPQELRFDGMKSCPITREEAARTFKDNTAEYLQRYKSPDPDTYKLQVYFLKKIMEFCRREGIELVLVNMPIMLSNAALLPPGAYFYYLQDMTRISFEAGVSFYDLCEFSQYQREDFYDSVHMNGFGGRKLMDALVRSVASDHKASSALALAGEKLKRQHTLAKSTRDGVY